MRCMQRILRFRMGCHKVPRDIGCWLCVPQRNKFCMLCQLGILEDEKHLVFECPALQDFVIGMKTCSMNVDFVDHVDQAPEGDAMILFMWQDDIIVVARYIDACSERVYTSAGHPVGDQASDQP